MQKHLYTKSTFWKFNLQILNECKFNTGIPNGHLIYLIQVHG